MRHRSDDPIETEVKFHLEDVATMHECLIELGAHAGEVHFETNIRFENPDRSLKRNDRLLRLRKDNECRLTFKKPPAARTSECKTYHELEVKISDFDTMVAILNNLGFSAVQRYEKRRRVYIWNDVELCIDIMPFGTFMEIEGSEERIKAAAAALMLPWNQRILTNYLAIFELIRKNEHLSFKDVTFDNFASTSVDICRFLPELWAAPSDADG